MSTASSAGSTSPTSCEAPSSAPRSATTPTTRMPVAASSSKAWRSPSTSSSPTSRREWPCTASRPTSSRRTPARPGSCARSASCTRGSRGRSCTCRARRPPWLARPRPLHDARPGLAGGSLPRARPPPGGVHRLRSRGLRRHEPRGRPRGRAGGAALLLEHGAAGLDALRAAPLVTGGRCRRVPGERPGAADGPGSGRLRPLTSCRCSTSAFDVPKAEVVRRALAVRTAFA